MYDRQTDQRQAGRVLDVPHVTPETRTRRALTRTQHLFGSTGSVAGLDLASLLADLDAFSFADVEQEQQRRLACGRLAWLIGDLSAAEGWFAQAVEADGPAEPAYWLARLRLLRGQAGLADYEQRLRNSQGDPQATAWFVDLLWRAGQVTRAEQIWKSLRGTPRLKSCLDWPLLEARWLARQADWPLAEKLLLDCQPSGGVLQTERLLLLAWVLEGRRLRDRAREALQAALQGVYPPAVLAVWRDLFEGNDSSWQSCSSAATAWREGQNARLAGETERARELLRGLQAVPLLSGHARHALACLGEGDFAAVLASLPGPFLAARCRWRLALDRFVRRQFGSEELLAAAAQTEAEGYTGPSLEAGLLLARWETDPSLTAVDLWQLATSPLAVEHGLTRVLRRLALEGVRRLSGEVLTPLLESWANEASELHASLGRRALLAALAPGPHVRQGCALAARLLPGSAWPALVARLAGIEDFALAEDSPPLVQLWRAAEQGETLDLPVVPGAAGLALALRVHAAARRGDAGVIAALLEDTDDWRGFPGGPPRWVIDAALSIRSDALPGGRWPRVLDRWLQRWAELNRPDIQALRQRIGTAPPSPSGQAPQGGSTVRWCLHQLSQALGRGEARQALAWLERALREQPELTDVAEQADTVRAALPELRQWAEAEALAEVVRLDPRHPRLEPGLLVGLAEALRSEPEGPLLLGNDLDAARRALADLARRRPLAPALARSLGIIYLRAAEAFEEGGDAESAADCWPLAWAAWLSWMEGCDERLRAPLLDHLLAVQRRRLGDCLARGEMDRAQRLWHLLLDLRAETAELRALLVERLERFRDDLATDQLVAMRAAMEHGEIAEGCRSAYEPALAGLSRLLSLDRDNLLLLTAGVETCAEWFLDLYNAQDFRALSAQVERFTPLALQLAQRIEDSAGELAARAALAEFWKFRGFVAGSWERKRILYREALAFNPANANVRNLLAELEGRVV